MPMAASSLVLGNPFSVLTYTLYGASRVFTPVMPKTVGSCVEMMVILAEVTKAEMGTYGMNSISQPRRRIPKTKSTAPARNESAWAMSSGL